jgi:glyoxylase-like metal-dependent hydrolase (beta-lactamase superfamily II)
MEMRSILCLREPGNLLVYGTSELEAQAPAIERLGGVSRHYFNHGHEAEFASAAPASPRFVHRDDYDSFASTIGAAEAFSKRHTVGEDFEVIPTPGHTPGATAFLWDTGEHRVLFTGDTIYLSEGEWVAAVLGSSDKTDYVASLELIRELEFDLLVPWIATAGGPFHAMTGSADARRRIDAILKRVREGEKR